MREVERALEQLLAARAPDPDPRRAGHRARRRRARAAVARTRRGSRCANGARLTANPLALLEEAREGALYCAEIGQYSKAEQKGLAFLLPKLDKPNVTLVCTSTEPLGNLAAEGKFDPALLVAALGRRA